MENPFTIENAKNGGKILKNAFSGFIDDRALKLSAALS